MHMLLSIVIAILLILNIKKAWYRILPPTAAGCSTTSVIVKLYNSTTAPSTSHSKQWIVIFGIYFNFLFLYIAFGDCFYFILYIIFLLNMSNLNFPLDGFIRLHYSTLSFLILTYNTEEVETTILLLASLYICFTFNYNNCKATVNKTQHFLEIFHAKKERLHSMSLWRDFILKYYDQ